MKKHYGHQLRILHWCTDQTMTAALARMELTAAQGHILGYLSFRQDAPNCRDLEAVFHLSHPTVSGLLSRMEKKGFIAIRPDPRDGRCKRIFLLDKGRECVQEIQRSIVSIENRMVEGFSPAEQAQFHDFLSRAIANLDNKEESRP